MLRAGDDISTAFWRDGEWVLFAIENPENIRFAQASKATAREPFYFFPVAVHRAREVSPMTTAKRKRDERVQVMLSADEIAAIDAFRFHARMPSRAAAARELLRRALAPESENQIAERARPKM